jgi:hypothetical protein
LFLSMRLTLVISILAALLIGFGIATAQPTDTAGMRWYDTLTVTEARYARVTPLEGMALSAFVAASVPATLAFALTSTFPPSIVVQRDRGVDRAGIALSSGYGFGGTDSTGLTWFPVVRLQGEVAYFFDSETPTQLRASVHADHRFGSIDRLDLLWFGVAGGAGVATDLMTVSPFGEIFVGLSNPLGVSHYPFRPMHHFGLRFRSGYNLDDSRVWHEAAFAITSTFGG